MDYYEFNEEYNEDEDTSNIVITRSVQSKRPYNRFRDRKNKKLYEEYIDDDEEI